MKGYDKLATLMLAQLEASWQCGLVKFAKCLRRKPISLATVRCSYTWVKNHFGYTNFLAVTKQFTGSIYC
jgi:hypothetical protein